MCLIHPCRRELTIMIRIIWSMSTERRSSCLQENIQAVVRNSKLHEISSWCEVWIAMLYVSYLEAKIWSIFLSVYKHQKTFRPHAPRSTSLHITSSILLVSASNTSILSFWSEFLIWKKSGESPPDITPQSRVSRLAYRLKWRSQQLYHLTLFSCTKEDRSTSFSYIKVQ